LFYPAALIPEKRGGFRVHFPDLPEAITSGDDRAEALAQAADCLDEAIAGRISDGLEIPGTESMIKDAMRRPTADNVCAKYADKGVKIMVKPLPNHPCVVLFEGDELAFEFLGKLFLAQAKAIHGCGFEIGPRYAGNALFSKKAKLGLYLHRLPCDNDALKAGRQAPTKKGAGAHI
jgi:predicted RNase H-like HicB family nuclease